MESAISERDAREQLNEKLRASWQRIIDKYSKYDLQHQGDIVDISTGQVVEDNGHLRSIKEDGVEMMLIQRVRTSSGALITGRGRSLSVLRQRSGRKRSKQVDLIHILSGGNQRRVSSVSHTSSSAQNKESIAGKSSNSQEKVANQTKITKNSKYLANHASKDGSEDASEDSIKDFFSTTPKKVHNATSQKMQELSSITKISPNIQKKQTQKVTSELIPNSEVNQDDEDARSINEMTFGRTESTGGETNSAFQLCTPLGSEGSEGEKEGLFSIERPRKRAKRERKKDKLEKIHVHGSPVEEEETREKQRAANSLSVGTFLETPISVNIIRKSTSKSAGSSTPEKAQNVQKMQNTQKSPTTPKTPKNKSIRALKKQLAIEMLPKGIFKQTSIADSTNLYAFKPYKRSRDRSGNELFTRADQQMSKNGWNSPVDLIFLENEMARNSNEDEMKTKSKKNEKVILSKKDEATKKLKNEVTKRSQSIEMRKISKKHGMTKISKKNQLPKISKNDQSQKNCITIEEGLFIRDGVSENESNADAREKSKVLRVKNSLSVRENDFDEFDEGHGEKRKGRESIEKETKEKEPKEIESRKKENKAKETKENERKIKKETSDFTQSGDYNVFGPKASVKPTISTSKATTTSASLIFPPPTIPGPIISSTVSASSHNSFCPISSNIIDVSDSDSDSEDDMTYITPVKPVTNRFSSPVTPGNSAFNLPPALWLKVSSKQEKEQIFDVYSREIDEMFEAN